MNLRYALYNMDSVYPIPLQGAQIRLHVQRNSTAVKRYYTITSARSTWTSPIFTSPYATDGSAFYDGDPLAEQREAINAVIACVQTEAWKRPAKPAPAVMTDYCRTCGNSLAGFRRGTKFCSDKCCRQSYRKTAAKAS